MEKEIIYSDRTQKAIRQIDGIEFEANDLGDYLLIGITATFLIITAVVWIWFWLLAKLVIIISQEKKVYRERLLCPKCKHVLDRPWGNRVECENCYWYSYLDWCELKPFRAKGRVE